MLQRYILIMLRIVLLKSINVSCSSSFLYLLLQYYSCYWCQWFWIEKSVIYSAKFTGKIFLFKFFSEIFVWYGNWDSVIVCGIAGWQYFPINKNFNILITATMIRVSHREQLSTTIRSSRPEVFCKNGVLRNFAKFTRKHVCQSVRSEACNFIKKETLAPVFSCEFCKVSKNTFSYRTPPVAASEQSDNNVYI